MSFYRNFIAVLALTGLSTAVLAADPAVTSTTSGSSASQVMSSNAIQTKLNINKASVKELMTIKGLSSGKAKAIVAYRKKHGQFTNIDQLKEVRGFKRMNEETMKSIQDQLTLS